MKKLCFGTLFKILYQAKKGSGVNNPNICDAIFNVYGWSLSYWTDSSKVGHLKNGSENVPGKIITAARNIGSEDASKGFDSKVIPLINPELIKEVILSVLNVIKEDNSIDDSWIVGYEAGYEKSSLISNNVFKASDFLASVFYYAIDRVENKKCKNEIKEIPTDYVTSFSPIKDSITLRTGKEIVKTTLKSSLTDPEFNNIFKKVSSEKIVGGNNSSALKIYCTSLTNRKFDFRDMAEFLSDNITKYVMSRKEISSISESKGGHVAGSRALKKFNSLYGAGVNNALGEMLVYAFLEQDLQAPKIMSKVEIDSAGSGRSKSDGIHLLTVQENGTRYYELVFGAADVFGDIKKSVDIAFEKIQSIVDNRNSELNMIESTVYGRAYDDETAEFLKGIILPTKQKLQKPDMAFGVFLGYSIRINSTATNNVEYRNDAETQMRDDIRNIKPYIIQKIKDYSFEGYNFYVYMIPFNDAKNEKQSIVKEIIEGK